MNPNGVCSDLEGEIQSVDTEYSFWSLDQLDVCIKTTDEWIGFEVKPSTADSDEIRRGLYQVMKYRSLLRAELLAEGSIQSHRCLFVLGGVLPSDLRDLAKRFGIAPIENILKKMPFA